LPDPLRAPLVRILARGLRTAGPVLDVVIRRLPVTPATVWLLRHSGFMLPAADPVHTARAMRRLAQQDWSWYFELALAVGNEPAMNLTNLHCPLTVLAGRYDILTDVRHVTRRLAAIPQARVRVLPTSHFVPLEAPAEVRDELRLLLHRADSLAEALDCAVPLTRGSPSGAYPACPCPRS
ncbi:MAG: alpha/beta hydrolase, partial [Actinomycetota bacterium]|nr:alpha/beta hydrolase [Actinomycetota bacterium]